MAMEHVCSYIVKHRQQKTRERKFGGTLLLNREDRRYKKNDICKNLYSFIQNIRFFSP